MFYVYVLPYTTKFNTESSRFSVKFLFFLQTKQEEDQEREAAGEVLLFVIATTWLLLNFASGQSWSDSAWPEKIAICLLKLPKNDFTRKMIDFDTFTKIAWEFERFWQINCCQSTINRPTWSHWDSGYTVGIAVVVVAAATTWEAKTKAKKFLFFSLCRIKSQLIQCYKTFFWSYPEATTIRTNQ